MQQQITIEMIESKNFRIKTRGYDQEEVDTFLDDICDEMERLLKTIQKLRQELKEAQNAAAQRAEAPAPVQKYEAPAPVVVAPPPANASTEEIREILEMTQRLKAEILSKAEAEAKETVMNAKAKADAQIGNLSSERERLTAEVDQLRTAVKDYREKFTELVRAQKELLDLSDI